MVEVRIDSVAKGPEGVNRGSARRRFLRRAETGVLFLVLLALMGVARAASGVRSPDPMPLYWLLLGILVLLWIKAGFQSPRASLSEVFADLCLAWAGLWMAFATFRGPEPQVGKLLVWESGLLLAVYARRRYRRAFGFRLLVVFAATVLVLQIVLSMVQYQQLDQVIAEVMRAPERGGLAGHRMVGGGEGRIARAVGVFPAANILGGWLALLLPFVFTSGLERAIRRRWLAAGFLLAVTGGAVVVLIRNLSRFSLLVGLVALLATLALHFVRAGPRGRRVVAVGAGGLGLALVLVAAVGSLFPRALGAEGYAGVLRAKVREVGDVTVYRLALQRSAVRAVAERPWLGVGFAGSSGVMPSTGEVVRELSPRLEQRHRGAHGRQPLPHNAYLMMAVDGGLPVLVLFLIPFLGAWGRYVRGFRRFSLDVDAAAVSVLAFALFGLAYNLAYFGELWPLSMFLFGSMGGAMRESPEDG